MPVLHALTFRSAFILVVVVIAKWIIPDGTSRFAVIVWSHRR